MSDIVLTTQTTPATPGSGKADVFVDSSTKQIKSVNDAGTVATYLTEAGHNVTAAVHGLPANVNVLGNRSAAGEFIQRSNIQARSGDSTVGLTTKYDATLVTVTYPVAFSSALFAAASYAGDQDVLSFATLLNIGTTAFSLRSASLAGGDATARTWVWIALGS